MTEELYVTKTVCELHREVIETKLGACDARVDGILEELQGVRQLQAKILYTVIFIAVGVCLTLFGVVLGRGIDFHWLVP